MNHLTTQVKNKQAKKDNNIEVMLKILFTSLERFHFHYKRITQVQEYTAKTYTNSSLVSDKIPLVQLYTLSQGKTQLQELYLLLYTTHFASIHKDS